MKYLQTPLIASVSPAPSVQRGFTLIELMTVMVITAVLLTVAVPNLSGFINSSRLRAAQSELAATLTMARSEAVKRGVSVGVSGLVTASGSEFSGGWQAWVDSNNNGSYDSGETVLRKYAALPSGTTVSSTSNSATAQTIIFKRTGFTSTAYPVTFKVCGSSSHSGFQIILEPSGMTDVTTVTTC